jgi:hypothetical protein
MNSFKNRSCIVFTTSVSKSLPAYGIFSMESRNSLVRIQIRNIDNSARIRERTGSTEIQKSYEKGLKPENISQASTRESSNSKSESTTLTIQIRLSQMIHTA